MAQETARLLDALCATTAPLTEPAPEAEPEAAPDPEPEAAPDPEPQAAPDPEPQAAEPLEPCPTCGHRGEATHTGAGSSPGSPADVCHLCPVCQLLKVVRAVRPETLDRLAELAGAVTEALRDAAAARWDDTRGSAPPPQPTRTPRTPRTPRTTVEDIPVGEAEDLGSWDEEAP
ncbi:MAG: hypothetical protein M3Y26_08535 [Actinomycetota bacterium]|nr:hypothetical protein [Actinomycetota bacterium]